MRGPSSGTVGGEATRRSTEVTDDRPTGFRRNLIPERRRVGGEVPRALERARSRPAPADDRRAMDGAREAYPPAASGDPRDRGATWDRADGDPRGTGIRGDRGSRGERVRALGRLRGAQLPRARRRRATRRRRQVPLGGGRQGRRAFRSRAQLPRPRRGRPDRARLHVRRRLVRDERRRTGAGGGRRQAPRSLRGAAANSRTFPLGWRFHPRRGGGTTRDRRNIFPGRLSYVQHLLRRAPLVLAALALLVLPAAIAAAAPEKPSPKDRAPFNTTAADDIAPSLFTGGAMQHGSDEGHLPGPSENVELIGELEPTEAFGPIVPGQIADLAVHKGFAYLNSWNEPTCTKGGFYSVDIRDPRNPQELAFEPALEGRYHGEGAHVISVATKSFTGDLLAVNNEHGTCPHVDTTTDGGFDLYDVSNPQNPRPLVQGAGDTGGEGRMNGTQPANTYHSAFMWKDDGKVYLVGTDNEEFHDVDIWDITVPTKPKPVAEYDLLESFPQISQTTEHPRLNEIFNHDMVVKEINGRDVMLDSYWDGGYVMLDVENPAKATYVGDTDFGVGDNDEDPRVPGISPPQGNAHQAEFSHDNTYFLGADEDFNPYRSDKFFVENADGTGQVERPAVEVGGGTSPAALPDQTLSGKVVYGGYGCPTDPTPLPQEGEYTDAELGLEPGDERILLMQRGPTGDPSADYNGNGDLTDDACFPGEKAARAFDAGWDAIVLVNRHLGSDDTSGVPFR